MARNGDPRRGDDTGTQIITKTRTKTKRPSLYKVLLLNDDYTPMDFVVYVLERFFNKPPEEATRIMLHVHQRASASAGSTLTRSPRLK
jgi:ATP-dependent Clp protease adaptor protein ClpS